MHKIYLDESTVLIRPADKEFKSDSPGEIHSKVSLFKESTSPLTIYIYADDTEEAYQQFCGEFHEVNAAGGIVRGVRGDYLMIRRNGKWDLPKGHQESGEKLEITAAREVAEETGIKSSLVDSLICKTDHCYWRNGRWVLKHSWWFNMHCTEKEDLVPQKEESISSAAWVSPADVPFRVKESYPSIVEVFKEAGII